LGDLDVSEWITLKSILEKLCLCELNSLGSDWNSISAFCECCNEPLCFI